MLRVSLRGIRAHIVRLLLSVLAVSLGVAFVAGTFSLRTMLGGTFDQIVDASTTADVYVKGPVFAGADAEGTTLSSVNRQVDLSLVDSIAAVDGVAQVQPDTSGPIVLAGKDGTAVRAGAAPSFGLAYWPEEKGRVLVDGKPPVGASQIALEVHALEKSGLAIGDTTSIVVNGAVRSVTVVGSVDWGSATAGATLVYLDPAVAQADYAPDGTVWSIAVFAKDGVSGSELATALDAALPQTSDGEHYDVQTGDEVRADSKSQVAKALGFVTTFLLIFAAISLFVGAFLISNTFAMLVRQRMRELALLRAIGASPLQVFASVLTQALVIGIVGSGLGVLGGLGLVNLLKVGLQSMGMTLDGQVPLDVSTVLISVVLGTVVSLLAAGLPARRAALIPPVEAMREEVTVHERSLRIRAMAGLLLAVVGAAAVTASALDLVENRNMILGVGATAVVIGVLMIAPTIARTAVTVLAAPLSHLFRPMTRLAAGNVVRNPRRTANTAGALMIGMALVGAVSVLAASATASTSSIVDEGTNADLVLRPALGLSTPAKAVDEVKALPELSAVDEFVVGTVSVQLPGDSSASPSMIGGFTPDMIGRGLVVKDVEGSSVGALTSGEAIVKVDQATSNDWSLGDEITLQGPTGESRTVAIGAIIDAPVVDVPVVVGVDVLDALVPPSQQWIGTVFLTVADGVSVTEARAAITDVVKPYIVISVMDRQDFVDSLADQVNQMLAILYALLGLSVIVAILGIVNTLALSVIERTREIGLLRAVGLGRLQLTGTIMIESVITAVFGTVVGLAVGVGLAAALPRIYADQGLRELAIPWASLGLLTAGSVLVGVLAALWPGIRAARLPVLDAISQE